MKPNLKKSSALFDEALSSYQEDLVKIIGKYRFSHHHLSIDEIISEVNLALFKNKEKLLESWGGFCPTKFKQIGYGFTRNTINWTQSRLNNNGYVSKRNNYTFETEDGVSTSFDLACDKADLNEEPKALSSDSNNKCSYILKMIKDYCFILTEQELKILTLKEEGFLHREIGVKLGITHQAVSFAETSIKEKIVAHLNIDPFEDNSSFKVSEGQKCLKDFFTSYPKFSPQDKSDLIDLIKSSIGQLTGHQISKTFKGGKFSSRQIFAFCAKNGLSPFLKKISNKSYNAKEEDTMIEMVSNGATVEEIVQCFDRDYKSVSSKLSYLSTEGRIPSYPPRSQASLSPEDKKLLKLFKSGHSSAEIAEHVGESNIRSISAKKGNFTKKGLLTYEALGKA